MLDLPRDTPMSARARTRDGRERRRLVAALAEGGSILPGSVVVRKTRCGKPNCRCRGEPPQLHGPYVQWTYTKGRKTITRWLSAEQQERYRSRIEDGHKLRSAIAELEAANVRAVESAEGWGR
jgi:hypothetical protein